ncbi:MAG: hypothetical protein IPP46_04415 [Bacteroidetes bacterium]|nr:hypothetical protein [Bacteroidota bacterium]
MNHQAHTEDFYKTIRENRMLMYSKPKRYFNRDEQKGSTFKYLFLIETIVFILLMAAAGTTMAQGTQVAPGAPFTANEQAGVNIHNYNTVYNSGKVFVSWTSKNETEDCVYVVERSGNGQEFQSVGVKEGIGSEIELYYSWIDKTPPAGFAYYRVKKITKEGTQLYSSVSSVINQSSNFENYAQGEEENK